jgi:hypothetical protein
MSRFLPVLCLFLVTASASAGDMATSDEPATKPGKTTAATAGQDADATPSAHPAATPAHTGTPRTPRWHSLLPGMIR